jgi:hypothetical protein
MYAEANWARGGLPNLFVVNIYKEIVVWLLLKDTKRCGCAAVPGL